RQSGSPWLTLFALVVLLQSSGCRPTHHRRLGPVLWPYDHNRRTCPTSAYRGHRLAVAVGGRLPQRL
ncbi:MAG: hypothetical protein ACETWR_05210, partial [Anaerolineae bacterium]